MAPEIPASAAKLTESAEDVTNRICRVNLNPCAFNKRLRRTTGCSDDGMILQVALMAAAFGFGRPLGRYDQLECVFSRMAGGYERCDFRCRGLGVSGHGPVGDMTTPSMENFGDDQESSRRPQRRGSPGELGRNTGLATYWLSSGTRDSRRKQSRLRTRTGSSTRRHLQGPDPRRRAGVTL